MIFLRNEGFEDFKDLAEITDGEKRGREESDS